MDNEIKKDITFLTESKNRSFFPERFSNEVYYSDLNSFHHSFSYKSNYSIKYTAKGCESYLIDDQLKQVPAGQYLIVNDQSIVETVESYKKSEGISIFVDPHVLKDVQYYLKYGDDVGPYCSEDFEKENIVFYDKTYNQGLGIEQKLIKIYNHIHCSNKDYIITEELFYSLAESMLNERVEIKKALNNISAVKLGTSMEIFRRVHIARSYILDNIREKFDFDGICLHSGVSKFQLIRNFKSVFKLSPYQYHLKHKLDLASDLLKNQNHSIGEISDILNFNDIHSFSRIFKKHNNVSPKKFQTETPKTSNF